MLVIRATGLTALESRASELLEDQVIFFMCCSLKARFQLFCHSASDHTCHQISSGQNDFEVFVTIWFVQLLWAAWTRGTQESACGKAEGNATLGSLSSSPPHPGGATFSLAAGTSCMLLHWSQLFGLTCPITATFPLHHYLKSTQLEGILIVSHITCMQTAVCTGLCFMFFSNGCISLTVGVICSVLSTLGLFRARCLQL